MPSTFSFFYKRKLMNFCIKKAVYRKKKSSTGNTAFNIMCFIQSCFIQSCFIQSCFYLRSFIPALSQILHTCFISGPSYLLYLRSFIAQPSISSNAWFSPAMPQINVYARVPDPEWIDQLGEMTACSLRIMICLVCVGSPI